MKTRLLFPIILIVLVTSLFLFGYILKKPEREGTVIKVEKGALTVWSVYEGKLEAKSVALVMSKFQGSATVIEMAAEGAIVAKGDILARFDSSKLEQSAQKLKRDRALALSELQSFKNAEMPLELRDLEIKLLEAMSNLKAEKDYLEASLQLMNEGLVSEEEVEQQKLKEVEAKTQLETLELRLKLTKEYLHPSALKRAQTKLDSADQELKFALKQIQNSVIHASTSGKVVYKSLFIGGEYRTIRIGDSVFANQPFMALPDMSAYSIHCEIPEVELSRVQEGQDVFIQPLAFPGMNLPGTVDSVSSMAQNPPEGPDWQRFFHVIISLNAKDIDPRLRPGLSVIAHILSYQNPEAVLIPRKAVLWDTGTPYVQLVSGTSIQKRSIKLGMANEESFEVLEGLNPGMDILSR